MVVHGRAGTGRNGSAAALAEILMNNGTTGGMGLGDILGLTRSLNRLKLVAVRAMGISNQGSAYRIPMEGEAQSDNDDIFRVEQYLKGVSINKSTTVISTIVNHSELGDILKDFRFTPRENWEEMGQYENEGSRERFVQWTLV